MIKTLKVMVVLEIRSDPDDDEQVRQDITDALQEKIEDDTLDYSIEESDDDLDL